MMRLMRQRVSALRARRVRGLLLPDVALAAVATSGVLLEGLLDRDVLPRERPHDVLSLALLATSTAAVAWRRRRPVLAFHVALGTSIGASLAGYPGVIAGIVILVQLYSVGAYARGRALVVTTGVSAVLVALMTWVDVAAYDRYDPDPVLLVVTGVYIVAPGLIGRAVRGNRRRAAERLEEATRAERLLRLEAEHALAEERARIARELHDVVAHHVSGIVLQAGAAERQAGRGASPPVNEALHRIRDSGTAALAAMREVVGLLRPGEEESGRRPQPTLDDLADLVGRARGAGQAVNLTVTGEARPLPAHLELCAYRVVQEALTNAARHAPGSAVDVAVDFAVGSLDVRVLDDGGSRSTGSTAPDLPGAGMGLVGIRERATAAGGRLEAGPVGHGWLVHAHVPVPAADRR
jgi:signal transduction histidine kinase